MNKEALDLLYNEAFELFEKYLSEGDSINLAKKKSGLTSLVSSKKTKRFIQADIRFIRLKADYTQLKRSQPKSWIKPCCEVVEFELPDGRLKKNELPLNSPIRQKKMAANNFLKLQLEIEKKIEDKTPKENVAFLPMGFRANTTLKP